MSEQDDLRALRTRLLKKHGEDIATELEKIDPSFTDSVVIIIALSTDAKGAPSRVSMVGNADTDSIQKILRLASNKEMLDTREAFERSH